MVVISFGGSMSVSDRRIIMFMICIIKVLLFLFLLLGVDDSALGLDLDLEELDMEYRILFEVFPDLLSC